MMFAKYHLESTFHFLNLPVTLTLPLEKTLYPVSFVFCFDKRGDDEFAHALVNHHRDKMALTIRRDRERRDFWKNKIKRNNYFRKMIVCRHRVVSALNCDILRMENMNPML